LIRAEALAPPQPVGIERSRNDCGKHHGAGPNRVTML
jgi:hypothetical protein